MTGKPRTLVCKTLSFLLALGVLLSAGAGAVSCGPDEPTPTPDPTPDPPPVTEVDKTAPTVSVNLSEVNVFGGYAVTVSDGRLTIGEKEVATWSDDKTAVSALKASVTFNGLDIPNGTVISEAGPLYLTVVDEAVNCSTVTIKIICQGIFGLESLGGLLQVDQEANILEGLSFAESVNSVRIEIEIDGGTTVLGEDGLYTPEYPGICNVNIILTTGNGTEYVEPVEGLYIKGLECPEGSVQKANIMVDDPDMLKGGIENFNETGVYTSESMIVESIENGTVAKDCSPLQSPEQIKKSGKSQRLIMTGERPVLAPGFEDMYEIIGPDQEPGYDDGLRHGDMISHHLLALTRQVLNKLGEKFKVVDFTQETDYGQILQIAKAHPELNIYVLSSSHINRPTLSWWDSPQVLQARKDLQELLKLENVKCIMTSFGNVRMSTSEGSVRYMQLKDGEVDTPNGGYCSWSSGADGVMGSDNYGITHSCTYSNGSASKHPSEANKNDDKLWNETSQIYKNTEATSEATPTACGKFRLASLLNLIANPDITNEENRKLIRDSALEGTVLVDGEEYCKTKRINPGAAINQFFSTLPTSISISQNLDSPIAIPHGLHKNSVILGPGVVDAEGTVVTEENYRDMFGRPLFISTKLIKKYDLQAGDDVEYVEYLCVDAKGTGAWDKPSEAFKSITSKTFTVSLTE